MHDFNDFASPSIVYFSENDDDFETNPTHLLSLAIKKRRSLLNARDSNMRIEIQLTGMIKSLCKHLGEDRAKRRQRHRRSRSRSRSQSKKRRWDSLEPVNKKYNGDLITNSHKSDQNNIQNPILTAQVVPPYHEQNIQSLSIDENIMEPLKKQCKLDNSLPHFNDDLNNDDPLGLDDLFANFNGKFLNKNFIYLCFRIY